ncbi:MAG: helix-turn-helix domain-containing protein [Myxococcales bacterium]
MRSWQGVDGNLNSRAAGVVRLIALPGRPPCVTIFVSMEDTDQVDLTGVSRRMLRPSLVAAREVGVDVSDLLQRLGADWETVTDPDARVPYELARDTLCDLERRVPDAFPLRAALHTTGADFGLLHYLWASSPTYRTGLAAAQRFHDVASGGEDFGRISLHEKGSTTAVRFSTGRARPFSMDAIFLGLVVANAPHGAVDPSAVGDRAHLVRNLAHPSEPPILVPRVCEARFPHARPGYAEGYYTIFARDEAMVFDAAHFELVFESASLDLPRRSAHRHLHALLSSDAARLVDAASPGQEWTRRTREALLALLESQPPTAERVGEALGVSASTLGRRLFEEGTSFRRVLDDLRLEQARHHLRRRELSLLEVAFLLGYSNLGAFVRAFRRWTNTSPAEYRRSTSR